MKKKQYTFNVRQALKVLAKKQDIDVKDIAKVLGFTPQAVYQWNTRNRIDFYNILTICNKFDIGIEELIEYGKEN